MTTLEEAIQSEKNICIKNKIPFEKIMALVNLKYLTTKLDDEIGGVKIHKVNMPDELREVVAINFEDIEFEEFKNESIQRAIIDCKNKIKLGK